MITIIHVQNTNEIPTAHQENYVLVDATDEPAMRRWVDDFVQDTGKAIGKIYRYGEYLYYIEVTA